MWRRGAAVVAAAAWADLLPAAALSAVSTLPYAGTLRCARAAVRDAYARALSGSCDARSLVPVARNF